MTGYLDNLILKIKSVQVGPLTGLFSCLSCGRLPIFIHGNLLSKIFPYGRLVLDRRGIGQPTTFSIQRVRKPYVERSGRTKA